jgi:membrane-bound serine protease (ClpP class)
MDPLIWSIAALVMMVGLVAVELFTPTMGGFLLAALAFAGLSVYAAYRHSEAAAFIVLALNVILFPLTLFGGFNLMRRSALTQHAENAGSVADAAGARAPHLAPGTTGTALTALHPAGVALFDKERVAVVTEGKFVDARAAVRVLRVEGTTVVVEPV